MRSELQLCLSIGQRSTYVDLRNEDVKHYPNSHGLNPHLHKMYSSLKLALCQDSIITSERQNVFIGEPCPLTHTKLGTLTC